MRRTVAGIVVLLLLGRTAVSAGDIYTLIREGNLQEASDSLSEQSSAALRDGRLLFFQSFLEKNGAESTRLMEAALNASVPARFNEEILLRLAEYYYLTGNQRKLSALVSEYRARWEVGRYEHRMLRFSILIDQQAGRYESALKQADRYLLRYSQGEKEQWGKIDKARILSANSKGIGATNMLRSLSRSDEGAGVPQSLYLLTMNAIERKRTDDAVFYYNLLRERYPGAVGLDNLVELFGSMSSESSEDNRAEEITGTFYSVKVGVFASKKNAGNHADSFKGYEQKIDTKSKKISGKNYYVVYVGRFPTFEQARQFKKQLESARSEVYQVIAR